MDVFMTNRKQRDEMRDYLVANLRGAHQRVEPVRIKGEGGVEPTTLLVDDNSAVLLVDQVFTGKQFRKWYSAALSTKHNVVPVFYKDGKTFFRSAAKDNFFKQQKELSLKHYTPEQMHRMIAFRPEEKIAFPRGPNGWIQYYQPRSATLEQGVVSFKFEPVQLDYSHLPEYNLKNTDSTRLHIWNDKKDYTTGALSLSGRFLVPSGSPVQPSQ